MHSKEQAMQEKARWLVRDYGSKLFMTATDTERNTEGKSILAHNPEGFDTRLLGPTIVLLLRPHIRTGET